MYTKEKFHVVLYCSNKVNVMFSLDHMEVSIMNWRSRRTSYISSPKPKRHIETRRLFSKPRRIIPGVSWRRHYPSCCVLPCTWFSRICSRANMLLNKILCPPCTCRGHVCVSGLRRDVFTSYCTRPRNEQVVEVEKKRPHWYNSVTSFSTSSRNLGPWFSILATQIFPVPFRNKSSEDVVGGKKMIIVPLLSIACCLLLVACHCLANIGESFVRDL